MNGENSKGILTQSQNNSEGRNIDGLNQLKVISDAKTLLEDFGYKVLSPSDKNEIIGLISSQSEKIENLEKLNHNSFFENKASSKEGDV